MSRIRTALFGLSFCLSLVAATAAVLALMEASDLGDPEVPLDAAAVALEELQRLREASGSPASSTSDIKRVVFLGDSTTLALPPRLMLFNTAPFAIFFAAVWTLYRNLPLRRRNGFLLGSSLLFTASGFHPTSSCC